MQTNLSGTFFMCQQMGRHLIGTKRPGCVISITSTHGFLGFPLRSTYGISKAAVMHMARMLAIEWAEHGIRVNTIAPGTVLTATRKELDLRDQGAVNVWFEKNLPEYVFLVAGTVGGILANSTRPAEFIYDNLMIHGTVVEARQVQDLPLETFAGDAVIRLPATVARLRI